MSPQRKLRATLDSRFGRTGPWCYTVKHFFTVSLSGICSVRLVRALSLQTGVPHFMTTSAFNYREMKKHKQPMSSRSKMDNVSLNVFTAGGGQKRLLLYQKGSCDTHTHTLWQCLSLLLPVCVLTVCIRPNNITEGRTCVRLQILDYVQHKHCQQWLPLSCF